MRRTSKRSARKTRLGSRLVLALTVATFTALIGNAARAQGASHTHWRHDWPRFRPLEYVATGVLAAGTLTVHFAVPQPEASWRGGALFDDATRDALRAESRSGRERADTASDVLLFASLALPTVGDTLVAGLAHRDSTAAFQMALVEAEAFALSFALTIVTKRLAARERPLAAECAKDRDYSPACAQSLDGSFHSGHASATFTAAGLVCMNHLGMPLWGGGAADVAACAGAMGLATTTGMLRIVADRHYATDVLVGTGVGLSAGMLVPWLLHYRGSKSNDVAVVPVTTAEYAGVFVTGRLP